MPDERERQTVKTSRWLGSSLALLLHLILIVPLWLNADPLRPETSEPIEIALIINPPQTIEARPETRPKITEGEAERPRTRPAAKAALQGSTKLRTTPPRRVQSEASSSDVHSIVQPGDGQAATATEPESTPSIPPPMAPDDWVGRLVARLERYKRYPYHAKFERQQGTVKLRLVINRAGRLLRADVVSSSGFPLLDQEALELLNRAEPLPSPPDDVPGEQLVLVVPIRFALR